MSATYDVYIRKGETWSFEVTRQDEDGDPIDLTGSTARFDMRATQDAGSSLLALGDGTGAVVTAAEGKITLTASATSTGALTPGTYWYEIEQIDGSVVTTILYGRATVTWGFAQ